MAIVCTGCGREYDVTLFQLGRTIYCTCGRRVGLEHRVTLAGHEPTDSRQPSHSDDVAAGPRTGADHRFFTDAMLGRLARWLRTLGYDTAYDDTIADDELVRRAFDEGRHIVTRDRKLFEEWRVDGLLLESEDTVEQLGEVVEAYDLDRPERLFARCRECNEVLKDVDLDSVEDRVPERVVTRLRREGGGPSAGERVEQVDHAHPTGRAAEPTIARCPGCDRVYWEGSHTERMRKVVDRVFGG